MEKERYENTQLEIIKFLTGDDITTSGPYPKNYEEDELPFIPKGKVGGI